MRRDLGNFIKKKDTIISEVFRSEKQHKSGKLTARERIDALLDTDSFEEYGSFIKCHSSAFGLDKKDTPSDGVVTGYGTIFGRPVFIFSQDFQVLGGSVGEMHAKKIIAIQKMAINAKIPIIGINDSGGARIQEGVDALAGYGDIFQNNIEASGLIPQISLIMGPCAGGAVYSPALTDFTFMVRDTSFMFITGPDVVKKVTFEDVNHESLGGSYVHEEKSGAVEKVFKNELEMISEMRRFFNFLPSSSYHEVPKFNKNLKNDFIDLNTILPENINEAYDIRNIILNIVDNSDFFELHPAYAKNIVIGFARIDGKTIGIIANQPKEMAGCIDINASRKGARFIRFCDSFNIPIITFVDTPGFLPGTEQEHNSIIRHGAKLLYAYGEATVPKITVITRKAYGGAYIVMGSKHLKTDINYSWPSAEIAVLGTESAAEILFKKEKENSKEYSNLKDEYSEMYINPYFAASKGYIDQIIKPSDTREMISRSLRILEDKSIPNGKKHDNLPM